MILHPAIIALLTGSLLTSALLLYAAFFAMRILRHWDLTSGSELQVSLERRTYLLTTVMACACTFQILSLFLFIHTADSICTLFSGAMCAAGTLNLNRFGYPALLLKLANFLLAGLWLIVNHVDSKGYDYPLIRVKYRLLLVIAPLLLAEMVVQGGHFLSLRPQVITSCCGSLFGARESGIASHLAILPEVQVLIALAITIALTLACGGYYLLRGKGGYPFAAAALVTFAIGAMALVSAIPVYIYALPTHHCPFCMLHREYGHIGYLLYVTLLGAGVAGLGAGALQPFRGVASLAAVLPVIQRRLVLTAMILYGAFGGVALWQIMVSELRLG
ncbi:MAG: hypothetical protein FD174_1225 [Geobacteraceae bacterium]|nr:MAG: hypothetical protein FD174_1225 [Geobacteraceae bacterium]